MSETNNLVELKNYEIELLVEPNSQTSLFRFAIYNTEGSKVKFLYNDRICEKEEVEPITNQYRINKKTNRNNRYIFNITHFGIVREENKHHNYDYYNDYDYDLDYERHSSVYEHQIYSHENIIKMKEILTPLLRKEGQKFELAQLLSIEAEFVDYQKSILKQHQLEIKATEEYRTF